MKKNLFLLIFLVVTHLVFGQKRFVFKQLGADTSSAIIGVCQYSDKQKSYKKYAFYIDKKANLLKVSQSVYCGDIAKVDTMDNDLTIFIINNKEAMPVQLGISPKYGYFNVGNDYYTFDVSQLTTLASIYPLNYSEKLMKFRTEAEFNEFIRKNKSDSNFLCYEDITEELEGQTTISIKIESSNKPATKGWNIIEKDLHKVGAKEEEDYIIGYSPSFDNTHIYRYKVQLSKKIYDKLNNPIFSKSTWTMNIKEIITYWRR